ncbi:MAG: VanZ family protein [Acetatifactor sp.]|nr:VanZ family protein [Acetatifactor sp.]
MTKYIIKDLSAVFGYLPYGVAGGVLAFVVLSLLNSLRCKKGKRLFSVPAGTLFFMYIVIMLFITFLSRESGSRVGVDMELFSTWGINKRNNAYVLENIMLFVPYGFLGACTLLTARNFFPCLFLGLFTSVEIEYMQMVTKRGFFQIDDILTNTLGAVIGYFIFMMIFGRKAREKEGNLHWSVRVFQIPTILLLIAIMLYLIAVTGICPTDAEGWLKPLDALAWREVHFFPDGTPGLERYR